MRNVVSALVLALIVLLSGGLTVVFLCKIRDDAARAKCANRLKQIGIGLQSYRDANDHFPPPPAPDLLPEKRLSWLAPLPPYMVATDWYRRMDLKKGWEAEENRYAAVDDVHILFQCPTSPRGRPASTLVPTSYVGIAGLGPDAAALPQAHPRAGFFGNERKLTRPDIEERAGTLLVAIETARTSGAWTAGGNATVRGLKEGEPYLGEGAQFGGMHRGGAVALFADGSVQSLRENIDPGVLRALATIQGKGEGEE
jgi:prepilin-type processing-associated H-X9-DG protein